MPHFTRYIGIDYSGAVTPESSCKSIRVFMTEGSGEPAQVQPPPSPRQNWTRRGLAESLHEELDKDIPTLVGIDHAFSFPAHCLSEILLNRSRYNLDLGFASLHRKRHESDSDFCAEPLQTSKNLVLTERKFR